MKLYSLDGQTKQHPEYGLVTIRFRRTASGRRQSVAELINLEPVADINNKVTTPGSIIAVFDLYNEPTPPLQYMGFEQ